MAPEESAARSCNADNARRGPPILCSSACDFVENVVLSSTCAVIRDCVDRDWPMWPPGLPVCDMFPLRVLKFYPALLRRARNTLEPDRSASSTHAHILIS